MEHTTRHLLTWSPWRRWHPTVAPYDHEKRREALTEAFAASSQNYPCSTKKESDAQAVQRLALRVVNTSKRDTRKINAIKPRVLQRLTVLADEFDQSLDHLNVANGVLNLRTGELEPHSPDQRFTYCLSVAYDPDAAASVWTEFLPQVMVDDPEVLPFLQMAVGYSLTGHMTEEKLFYLYGPEGRNGKGTFAEPLLTLLGKPLAKGVDFSTFPRDRDKDAQNFDLAPLKPARFLVASESKQHERLNEAKVKQATGGDELYCAHKNKPHFSYRPMFKIWLLSNYDVNADPNGPGRVEPSGAHLVPVLV